jgi:ATP-binding cassette subfamily F protein 3
MNEKVAESQGELTETMTLMNGEFETAVNELTDKYGIAIEDLDKSAEARTAATNTFEAFLNGMNDKIPGILSTMNSFGQQLTASLKNGVSGVNFTINRGEKVAFVGRNGEGKTTLVRCILGELDYDGGITIGHNVETAYFAQHEAQLLDENQTVFQTIDNVATGDIRLRIRDILGAFMFGGEASDKPVKVLSGGERSRLAMIRLLLRQMNLLILDEPTNHLDMQSKDVLKDAIRDFDGTVIIVSHDREFLDGLVTKVYEFGDGKVREHLGGIYDYLAKKNASNINEAVSLSKSPTQPTADTPKPANGNRLSYEAEKQLQKQRRKLEKQVEDNEKSINELEGAIAALESLMSTADGSTPENFTKYATLKKQLDEAVSQWEKSMEELENLNQ